MLTLKLRKGHVTKLLEVKHVDVFPCGRQDGSEFDPTMRTNNVREISVELPNGEFSVYYVAANGGMSEGPSPTVVRSHAGPSADYWDLAYVENSHGATVETVKPY